MFDRRHFDQMRDLFADQFEPDGADFLYRRSSKGAPIRVSAGERDAFLDAFGRQYRRAFWGFLIFVILAIFGMVALFPDAPNSGNPLPEMIAGFIVLPAIILLGVHWMWNAPARALQHRQAVGFERSRDEMRAIKFAKITYRNLALATLGVPLLLLQVSGRFDVLHGWGRLWLIVAAIAIVLIAIQIFRKWRFERDAGL